MAQDLNLKELSSWRLKQMGKHAERLNDPYHAIDFYSYYLAKKDNYKVRFKLAELHIETRDYRSALNELNRLQKKQKNKHDLLLFRKAQVLKSMGLYPKAIETYSAFRQDYRSKNKAYYRKRAKVEIEGCEMALDSSARSDNFEISHLKGDINNAHLEFSPQLINENELIYGSLKTNQLIFEDSTEIPKRLIYRSIKKSNTWFDQSALELKVPQNMDIGSFFLDEAENELYLSLCELDWQHRPVCAIYVSKKTATGWSKPDRLAPEINASNSSNTQPCIGFDSKKNAKVLYFVSDRKSGKGGKDIWFSRWNEKKQAFEEARNAGPKINSTENERSPYYDREQARLYFSSEGHPGLGGYDVFYSLGNLRKWTEPQNLGPNFNSSFDELDFRIRASKGLFVSNRSGTIALKSEHCCDDVFEFERTSDFEEDLLVEIYELPVFTALNKRVDSSAATALGKFPFDISILTDTPRETKDQGENEEQGVFIREQRSDESGVARISLDRRFNYRLSIDHPSYFFTYKDLTSSSLSIEGEKVIKLYVGKYDLSEIIIPNIYYPFDEYYLTEDAKQAIDTSVYSILLDNPKIIIEIGSHTDSKGTDAYNIKLSENRAKSVVNYLRKKGIDKERLQYRGYGEAKPLVSNTKEDGSDDLDARAKNRRTSFRIIGVLENGERILYDDNFGGIKADR